MYEDPDERLREENAADDCGIRPTLLSAVICIAVYTLIAFDYTTARRRRSDFTQWQQPRARSHGFCKPELLLQVRSPQGPTPLVEKGQSNSAFMACVRALVLRWY